MAGRTGKGDVKSLKALSFTRPKDDNKDEHWVNSKGQINVFKVIKEVEKQQDKISKPDDDGLDNHLKAKTKEFRKRLHEHRENWEDVLPEAVAVFREALKRKHPDLLLYNVQMIGGIVAAFGGKMLQQATGEGKTFTIALAAYLLSLQDKENIGVHCMTVSDYLSKRDAEILGNVFEALGLSVGVLGENHNGLEFVNGKLQEAAERGQAYKKNIVYGTVHGFGFDYLQDHLLGAKLQQGFFAALIDEADWVLIEEANTPLIISDPPKEMKEKAREIYYAIDSVIWELSQLKDKDKDKYYTIKQENQSRHVMFTPAGYDYVSAKLFGTEKDEQGFDIPRRDIFDDTLLVNICDTALKAHHVFVEDTSGKKVVNLPAGTQPYRVEDGEVCPINSGTGRSEKSRRFQDGIQEALEAKKHNEELRAKQKPTVETKNPSMTVARITLQSFFKKYKILSGFTGTAQGIETELKKVYDLQTIVVPTHRPKISEHLPDIICLTHAQKIKKVINEALQENQKGTPLLIATTSVNKSADLAEKIKAAFPQTAKTVIIDSKESLIAFAKAVLSREIDEDNLLEELKQIYKKGDFGKFTPIFVLNDSTKIIEKEIVSLAGVKGAITVATGMAGRGTDIKLVEAVKMIDGLYVLGTEYPVNFRDEWQLRGREGRQGQPGKTRFYISLEDDLFSGLGAGLAKELTNEFGEDEDGIEISGTLQKRISVLRGKIGADAFKHREELGKDDKTLSTYREYVYEIVECLVGNENERADLFTVLTTLYSEKLTLYKEKIKEIVAKYQVEQTGIEGSDVSKKPTENDLVEQISIDDETLDVLLTALKEKISADKEISSIDAEDVLREMLAGLVSAEWTDFIFGFENLDFNRKMAGLGGLQKDEKALRAQIFEHGSAEMFEDMLAQLRSKIKAALSVPLASDKERESLEKQARQQQRQEEEETEMPDIFEQLNPEDIKQRLAVDHNIKPEEDKLSLAERISRFIFKKRGNKYFLRAVIGKSFYAFITFWGIITGLFAPAQTEAMVVPSDIGSVVKVQETKAGFSFNKQRTQQTIAEMTLPLVNALIEQKIKSPEFQKRYPGLSEDELSHIAYNEVVREIIQKSKRGEDVFTAIRKDADIPSRQKEVREYLERYTSEQEMIEKIFSETKIPLNLEDKEKEILNALISRDLKRLDVSQKQQKIYYDNLETLQKELIKKGTLELSGEETQIIYRLISQDFENFTRNLEILEGVLNSKTDFENKKALLGLTHKANIVYYNHIFDGFQNQGRGLSYAQEWIKQLKSGTIETENKKTEELFKKLRVVLRLQQVDEKIIHLDMMRMSSVGFGGMGGGFGGMGGGFGGMHSSFTGDSEALTQAIDKVDRLKEKIQQNKVVSANDFKALEELLEKAEGRNPEPLPANVDKKEEKKETENKETENKGSYLSRLVNFAKKLLPIGNEASAQEKPTLSKTQLLKAAAVQPVAGDSKSEINEASAPPPPPELSLDTAIDSRLGLPVGFNYPVTADYRITAGGEFGARREGEENHKGLDFIVNKGTAVFPSMPGRVIFSGWLEDYGNTVIIRHDAADEKGKYYTLYAHNDVNLVKTGDIVAADTQIAQAGVTGNAISADGGCVHFEIRQAKGNINDYNGYLRLAALNPRQLLEESPVLLAYNSDDLGALGLGQGASAPPPKRQDNTAPAGIISVPSVQSSEDDSDAVSGQFTPLEKAGDGLKPSPAQTVREGSSLTGFTYTVKKGDTVYQIAKNLLGGEGAWKIFIDIYNKQQPQKPIKTDVAREQWDSRDLVIAFIHAGQVLTLDLTKENVVSKAMVKIGEELLTTDPLVTKAVKKITGAKEEGRRTPSLLGMLDTFPVLNRLAQIVSPALEQEKKAAFPVQDQEKAQARQLKKELQSVLTEYYDLLKKYQECQQEYAKLLNGKRDLSKLLGLKQEISSILTRLELQWQRSLLEKNAAYQSSEGAYIRRGVAQEIASAQKSLATLQEMVRTKDYGGIDPFIPERHAAVSGISYWQRSIEMANADIVQYRQELKKSTMTADGAAIINLRITNLEDKIRYAGIVITNLKKDLALHDGTKEDINDLVSRKINLYEETISYYTAALNTYEQIWSIQGQSNQEKLDKANEWISRLSTSGDSDMRRLVSSLRGISSDTESLLRAQAAMIQQEQNSGLKEARARVEEILARINALDKTQKLVITLADGSQVMSKKVFSEYIDGVLENAKYSLEEKAKMKEGALSLSVDTLRELGLTDLNFSQMGSGDFYFITHAGYGEWSQMYIKAGNLSRIFGNTDVSAFVYGFERVDEGPQQGSAGAGLEFVTTSQKRPLYNALVIDVNKPIWPEALSYVPDETVGVKSRLFIFDDFGIMLCKDKDENYKVFIGFQGFADVLADQPSEMRDDLSVFGGLLKANYNFYGPFTIKAEAGAIYGKDPRSLYEEWTFGDTVSGTVDETHKYEIDPQKMQYIFQRLGANIDLEKVLKSKEAFNIEFFVENVDSSEEGKQTGTGAGIGKTFTIRSTKVKT
ncbi:MAG: peptidoglycan DD-metalloendopeptidase family protein, partial [Candidatus Omnitrophica bacterium]|nr:peptidoglycan DD-metalloendopeptidase family protein [Candidatus Omnitrophota bacterium]